MNEKEPNRTSGAPDMPPLFEEDPTQDMSAFIQSVMDSIGDEDVSVDDTPTKKVPGSDPEPTRPIPTTRPIPNTGTIREKTNMKKRRRIPAFLRALIYIFVVGLLALVLAMFAWDCALDVLALTKPDREVTVTVTNTDTIDTITQKLYESDLIDHQWLFKLYCKFSHADQKIDPGVYTLNNLFDYHALVNGMMETAVTRDSVKVTIPEGYECDRIFHLLEDKGVCSYEDLTKTAANYEFSYEFLAELPYGSVNRLEGYLFPDTYEFYVGDDAVNVFRKFLNNFERKIDTLSMEENLLLLNANLRQKMEENNFTEEQIQAGMIDEQKLVIVASIIEKETAGASESGAIASVIYNRLCSNLYPLLQIDATIQYVLPERKEVLSQEDLQIDSPYNTYRYPGLTPGPIANPGLESLRAALNPNNTTFFFYALDKNGWHHFSSSYFDHQEFLEGLNEAE